MFRRRGPWGSDRKPLRTSSQGPGLGRSRTDAGQPCRNRSPDRRRDRARNPRPIALAVVLVVATLSTTSACGDRAAAPTLEQLIGQKLVVRMDGRTPSTSLLARAARRGEIGGVIVHGFNFSSADHVVDRWRAPVCLARPAVQQDVRGMRCSSTDHRSAPATARSLSAVPLAMLAAAA